MGHVSAENYFYAGQKLVATKSQENILFIYQDRLLSDITTKTLPFGQVIKQENRFGFTGKELDEDGLHYFGARYLDSNTGRFLAVDSVPSEPSYQYVSNNPLNKIDPTGTEGFRQTSEEDITNFDKPQEGWTNYEPLRIDNHGWKSYHNPKYDRISFGSGDQERTVMELGELFKTNQLQAATPRISFSFSSSTDYVEAQMKIPVKNGQGAQTLSTSFEESLFTVTPSLYGPEDISNMPGIVGAISYKRRVHDVNSLLVDIYVYIPENAIYSTLNIDFLDAYDDSRPQDVKYDRDLFGMFGWGTDSNKMPNGGIKLYRLDLPLDSDKYFTSDYFVVFSVVTTDRTLHVSPMLLPLINQ